MSFILLFSWFNFFKILILLLHFFCIVFLMMLYILLIFLPELVIFTFNLIFLSSIFYLNVSWKVLFCSRFIISFLFRLSFNSLQMSFISSNMFPLYFSNSALRKWSWQNISFRYSLLTLFFSINVAILSKNFWFVILFLSCFLYWAPIFF